MRGTNWRMASPCANCPFSKSAEGVHLRKTLGRSRWSEILGSLRAQQHFICHKTGSETGDGSELVCAGALDWQEKHGVSSNYQRVMERLDAFMGKGGD